MADVNVWLALSWDRHVHSQTAWRWFQALNNEEVIFCRITQIGLLRLLMTQGVMQADCLTMSKACTVYDQWLSDPRTMFRQEPLGIDSLFRKALQPFLRTASPKSLADCYLLALSQGLDATLVTLDQGLAKAARRIRHPVVLLE